MRPSPPVYDEQSVLHVGGAIAYRQPTYAALDGSGGEVRFRTRNETKVTDYKNLNTGYIANVDDFTQLGGELAYRSGRFMAQGEYVSTAVKRIGGLEDLSFGGGYAFAAFFLTDDTHPYDPTSGEFGKVIPRSERGALEVLVRYSDADLSDRDVLGGTSKAWTAGLTWYANPNIKVYSSYTMIDNDEDANDDGGLVGNDDYGIFQMRFLAAF